MASVKAQERNRERVSARESERERERERKRDGRITCREVDLRKTNGLGKKASVTAFL